MIPSLKLRPLGARSTLALATCVLSLALAGCGEDDSATTGTVRITLQDAPVEAEKVEVTISEVSVHFVPAGGDDA